jgi:hypothetical protein
MKEKYKAIIDRSVHQMKRRSGTFRRIGTGRSKTCGQNDHMMVSLATTTSKNGRVTHSVCLRFQQSFAEAFDLKIGDRITMDYEVAPEGCVFVIRRASEQDGVSLYRTSRENNVRTAFTPRHEDIENLFSATKRYRCELKHQDDDSGVFVFEELK